MRQPSALPAIAVVLPFRNAEPWLAEALASLATAAQGLAWQLLAVNDGSSDGSVALLQRLTGQWPTGQVQILQSPCRGVSAARNLGIEAARAPLIAFLDADDRVMPQRLQAPLRCLQANPQFAHAQGGWISIQANGQALAPAEPWREGAGFDRSAAFSPLAVRASAWTIRRDVLIACGGFDTSLAHAEDLDLLLRLSAAGHQGRWLQQPLARHRVHAAAASRNAQAQIQALNSVVDRHLQHSPPHEPAWAAALRYGTRCWGAWKAWREGESSLALQLLEQARSVCPWPVVRRPVQFLEFMARCCEQEGPPLDLEVFLASRFWLEARSRLLQMP